MKVDRNCLSYWFPKLLAAGVPVPRTEVVRADTDLTPICDGELPPGWSAFLAALNVAIAKVTDNAGGPVFLRTGQGSGKHDWRRTCYFDPATGTLPDHVAALVEWSHMVSFFGLPHDVWVARELLPVEPVAVLPGYDDMPLVPEVRAFVGGGRVRCSHPYWPTGAIRDGLPRPKDLPSGVLEGEPSTWTDPRDAEARRLFGLTLEAAAGNDWQPLAERVAAAFADDGAWSVDLLPTRRGWFVTDMAEAERSFHFPGCHQTSLPGCEILSTTVAVRDGVLCCLTCHERYGGKE